MDACAVDQFEQFIRAVAGLPLGDPGRHSDAVMTNLIGAEAEDWETITGEPAPLRTLNADPKFRFRRYLAGVFNAVGVHCDHNAVGQNQVGRLNRQQIAINSLWSLSLLLLLLLNTSARLIVVLPLLLIRRRPDPPTGC